jgi:CHAT domain-containing protein
MVPLPSVQIQRRLAPNVVIVSLTLTPSSLFTCVLSRSRLEVIEQQGGEALLRPLVDTLADGFARPGRLPRTALRLIAEALLRPVTGLPAGTHIVFVPDGSLHRVPFAALPEDDRGRYLVEDHVISIAPSATLYVRSSAHDCRIAHSGAPSILLVASPEAPSGTDLPRLPSTIHEASAISALYRRHRLIRGSDADPRSFLGMASAYDIIHFAGHSIVDEKSPDASCLLFGASGRLRASEIESSDLSRVRLVVLSGCSTGVGKTHPSEGVMSLARAFIAAGLPAVIGTVAPVDDATASHLLIEFHRAYAKRLDPAAALREAQLRMLASAISELRDPGHWSAFEVVGGTCAGSTESKGERVWDSH